MTDIKNSVIAGIAFGVLFGIYMAFVNGFEYAIIAAPLSALAFGAGIYFFISSKKLNKQTEIEVLEGESILYSGRANHFKGTEAVGGKLYLLSNKLQFKSHGFNMQNHEQIIDIKDISKVSFYNTLGLIPNGLTILTNDGKAEKFVIGNRKTWKEKIEGVM